MSVTRNGFVVWDSPCGRLCGADEPPFPGAFVVVELPMPVKTEAVRCPNSPEHSRIVTPCLESWCLVFAKCTGVRSQIAHVWLWDDWRGRWGIDADIDIVVEQFEVGWAV